MPVTHHVRSILVGVASGARSSLGFATASFGTHPPTGFRPLDLLCSRRGRGATATMVAAELIVDKLPQTPSRLTTAGLLPRLASGAVGAAALAWYDDRRGWVPAAALGAAGAAAGSWAGFQCRAAAKRSGVPDLLVALAEDAAALTSVVLAPR